jgi:hypothetical protein
MSNPILLIVAAAAVAALYWIWRTAGSAYLKFRGPSVITCPENRQPAGVNVDARHAAATAVSGRPDLRLSTCSRWPERADCGRECLRQIEAAPEDCLVRNILARWYRGKSCVFCGHAFGEINWAEHRPALLSPERRTVEWLEVPAELVPAALESHLPVCWNCHMVNRFMHTHPELVVDRSRTA